MDQERPKMVHLKWTGQLLNVYKLLTGSEIFLYNIVNFEI